MGTDGDSASDASETPSSTALALIEEQAEARIRRVWHRGRWFFSVIDVIGLLTDAPTPRNYWAMVKNRAQSEGFRELLTKCEQLKMRSADGKQRETDAADTETLLRIIQSVPSPKAEPVKQWLAKVGATELQRVDDAASRPPLDPAEASTALAAVPKPPQGAPALQWARYYQALADLYQRVAEYEQRLTTVDATLALHDAQLAGLQDRVESVEAMTRQVLPDILERLAEMGPQTLSPEHQATVKALVGRLHELGGFAYGTIYGELTAAFHVGKYSDIPDAEWPHVAEWFKQRLDAAGRKPHYPAVLPPVRVDWFWQQDGTQLVIRDGGARFDWPFEDGERRSTATCDLRQFAAKLYLALSCRRPAQARRKHRGGVTRLSAPPAPCYTAAEVLDELSCVGQELAAARSQTTLLSGPSVCKYTRGAALWFQRERLAILPPACVCHVAGGMTWLGAEVMSAHPLAHVGVTQRGYDARGLGVVVSEGWGARARCPALPPE